MKTANRLCFRLTPLLGAGLLLVSCDSPQKRALRTLSEQGVEPTGKALLEAVRGGDKPRMDLLLKAGVHTGYRDPEGRTPLHVAIEKHDSGTAFRLLEAGADANAADARKASALGYALAADETAIATRLLDAGAKADGRMPDGEGMVAWAIRENRLEFVKRAVASGVDPHLTDSAGNSLVQVAMLHDRKDMLGILLDRGADAAAVDGEGQNLLHRALDRGWLDLVPRLLKAGADPNATDAKGRTPVEVAIIGRNLSLLGQLLSAGGDPHRPNPAGQTPLSMVLAKDWPEARRLLAKSGADFNRPGPDGKSALSLAMEKGDCALAKELTGYGAKLPDDGWSAWLARAMAAGDTHVVRQLMAMGVTAARRDATGYLPVEVAALRNHGSLVRALVESGSPVGDALYLACAQGNREMAELLLACGAPVNPSRVPHLDTPLAAAIRSGNQTLVCSLLDRGALPLLRAGEGQPPLHLAIALGRPAVVQVLLKKGANPNAPFITPVRQSFMKHVSSSSMRYVLKSDRNVTPLMLAATSGEVATAVHLLAAGAKKNVTTRVSRYWPVNFACFVGDVRMTRVLLGRDPHLEERVIVVSLSEQRARVYNQLGEEIYSTRVSTGKPGFRTPTGEYAITDKNRHWTSTLYHASMPFFQRLSGSDFGLHEGVVPGYPASHGCIRVPAGNAQKLFSMTQTGDRVKIVP